MSRARAAMREDDVPDVKLKRDKAKMGAAVGKKTSGSTVRETPRPAACRRASCGA